VLAEEIVKPGIEAVVMFRIVQRRVRVAINQAPYLSFNAIGDVYFGDKPDLSPATPDPLLRLREAEKTWASAKDLTSIVALEDFVARYQDTSYAALARARIEALRNKPPPNSHILPFDGNWSATLDCPKYQFDDAYSQRFDVFVKDGVLHGEIGEKGKPGWRTIDGKITRTGSASLREHGLMGASNNWATGMAWNHNLSAQFEGMHGTAKRINIRAPRKIALAAVDQIRF
jgi:hypothetical protein